MSRKTALHGVDQILKNAVQGYSSTAYIAKELLKLTPVKRDTDKFLQFGKDHFKKVPDEFWERAYRADAYNVETELPQKKSYICTEKTLQGRVDKEEVIESNAAGLINLLKEGVEQLQERHELNKEIRIADMLQDVTNYNGNVDTPSVKWTNTTEVDKNIEVYKQIVENGIGRTPNVLLFGDYVYNNAIKFNEKLAGRLASTERAILTEDLLAKIFGVDKVVVGRGVYVDEAGVTQKLWGNATILAYVNPGSGRKIPTFARLFQKVGKPQVKQWFTEPTFHDFWVQDSFDVQITGPDAGYLVVSPV